jgi:hypothetical protein
MTWVDLTVLIVWGWIGIHALVLAAVLLGSGNQATTEVSATTRRSAA